MSDPTANWPQMPTYPIQHPDNAEPYKTNRILSHAHNESMALEARLRTTAEALREIVASGIEHETRKYAVMQVGLDELADARAVLAALEKEGLA